MKRIAFVLLSLVFCISCGDSETDKEKEEEEEETPEVPESLQGTWIKDGPYSKTLVAHSDNFEIKDGLCKGKFRLKSLEEDGDNRWSFEAKSPDKKRIDGKLSFNDGENSIEIEAEEVDGCYIEALVGGFTHEDAMFFPESITGKWTSCGVEDCDRVLLTIDTKTFSVAGTGGKSCITDAATLERISKEGAVLDVYHSGLNSSGWSLNITMDESGIAIGGASAIMGTYEKGETQCP